MFDPDSPAHWNPSARLPKLGKPTDSELRGALERVVAYNWTEEREDFDENPEEDHIYHALRVLHAHLYGKD